MTPYGRLDVFWPDGKFQTFPLDESTVSVGRSSGNTVALDTENISRYHFSLTRDGDQVFITDLDSANGTFVDGVRLRVNEPQPLYGGEEILIGDLRMIFADLDDSPTRPMVVPEDATQRVEVEAPTFRIDLMGPPQAVSPGAHISAELSVTNTGLETERFIVEVTGIPREWIRLDRPYVDVKPNKTESVVLSFKPLRRPESAPGNYHAMVTVRPNRESVTMLTADLVLSVLPYGGFGTALDSHRLTPADQMRLHLHNQGSSPLPIEITLRSQDDMLTSDLTPAQMTLGPGQRLIVHGRVHPRRRSLIGESREYPFDVVIRSLDAAAFTIAQRAYLTVAPPLPRWAPLALMGAVGAVTLVLILAIVFLTNRPIPPPVPPIIESFAVSAAEVVQGEPLVIAWNAENANRVSITLNGTSIFTEQGDLTTESYTVNTSDLSGELVVGIEVENAAGRAVDTQTVLVASPLRVDLFTVDPPRLVRNVVESLTLSWSVPGAATTRISGLEGFTTARIEPAYGPQATLTDIVGIPQQPLTLVLVGQDAEGNVTEQTLVVEVIDPVCAPESEAITLHAEPNEDAQVVGTVPEGNSVIVDAQDETRQWLRVVLPGGAVGWGPRTEFACASNFNVGNLRQVLVIPTVAPTLTTPETPAGPTAPPVVTATPRPAASATPAGTASPTRTPTPGVPGP